jgi:hypothetical protein
VCNPIFFSLTIKVFQWHEERKAFNINHILLFTIMLCMFYNSSWISWLFTRKVIISLSIMSSWALLLLKLYACCTFMNPCLSFPLCNKVHIQNDLFTTQNMETKYGHQGAWNWGYKTFTILLIKLKIMGYNCFVNPMD